MTRRAPMRLAGRAAVVTGAAGGIGRGIALSLARRGCDLALCDIDANGLAGTCALVESARVRVSRHTLDVADRAAVAALPAEVARTHGRLDLLVNNAGVALGGAFEQVSERDFDWLFDINFHGLVRMTRAFLPWLHESDDARIVNLSSLFGLIAPPGQSAYAASKFAVRGFSQALALELADSRVGVTVAHPGGVRTAIARNARRPQKADPADVAAEEARFERLLRLSPDVAAETIVRAAERRRTRVLVGGDAKALALIERLAPVSYWRLIGRLAA
jgi:NAD(P)-dependent dehydrogenase (short-subunit alcohol dehydrogenase family)